MKTIKLISWNVNGIRAVVKKNFKEFVKDEQPDLIAIQETKAHQNQVDEMLKEYGHHYWNSALRGGYAGTAVFSKMKPLAVRYGINNKETDEEDTEGRVLTLEFEQFYFVTVYTPNSGEGLRRLDYRQNWDRVFLKFLTRLQEKKPVVLCGDLNVAHTAIDLAHPIENYNKTAGYTQGEIDGFQRYIDHGFVDTFREYVKEGEHYSYWSYRFNARKKNVGWRIDYFLVSKRFMKHVNKSWILKEVQGSDHCPVGLEIIM